ncbi:hypothetical protein QC761_0058170 [Podospora bellae-mahoneyi]|uniref:Uncharacterized protein n=1 Tax=Podospora bellae-mahoneyi TaxID=2093777 RepID=A0ABR0FPD9_9PEZI|nr:hypothetical protein QC761_0058170 [Podospora bellae-mahoneyi]
MASSMHFSLIIQVTGAAVVDPRILPHNLLAFFPLSCGFWHKVPIDFETNDCRNLEPDVFAA